VTNTTEIVPDLENRTRQPSALAVEIPPSRRTGKDDPSMYIPDPGLVDAMRAALLLRRPLLLTGEPGTGKTQAAHYLNWKLGYGKTALRFDAKSTSTARDLFYTYDTIGRFYAAQTKEGSQNNVDYIRYNSLGEAILRANEWDNIQKFVPSGFPHSGHPSQSVVLIDEIDKAPRDFPNDVLNEIEHMRFRVPELGNIEFAAEEAFFPVLVMTSNSEKNLPAAFLRRCLYYNIPKPDQNRFSEIVNLRLGVDTSSALMKDALDFLFFLRGSEADLSKKPATAELLDWILLLQARGAQPEQQFHNIQAIVESTLPTIVKDETRNPKDLLKTWLERRG
jgi:MoxR-like ATPase